jgi:hypothetical protein
MEYEFRLTYQLSPHDNDQNEIVERLGAAGCTDALIGTGNAGCISLEFIREAASAKDAMESARRDVEGVIPSARLIEAAPDLVGVTDVAEIMGVSRQNIRKLLERHAASAPAPVHAGSPALWHLSDMLSWLRAQLDYQYPQTKLEVAYVAERINLQTELARQETRGVTYA